MRLHFVEFYGKFYSPGGRRYEPFAHWRPTPGA
jgi:vacuolar-type H+-ATPase subunit I/STV1